ncbi:hypothetical protein FKM82_025581 [Ascaphus truei]
MWSGLFPHLTESWNNFKCLDPDYPTWMDLVKNHGYITQKFGKQDYKSGSHSLSNRIEAWTRDVQFLLRQEGRPFANLTGNQTQTRVMEEDWKNTDTAVSWIRKEATKLSQPFFLYLGLNLPHPYPSQNMGENFGSSTFLTSLYWFQKVISALNDTGLLGTTYVLFTSDHGELAMDHRQFYKMSMYEGSSHIPLLIMGPKIKPRQQIANIVSLVDLYPTMLDIAGVPIPHNISGFSLMPILSAKSEDDVVSSSNLHPNWALSEFHGCDANASTYMLRDNYWKYIAYSDGDSVPPQLFDLSTDPDELRNVAAQFPEKVGSLEKKLRSILDYTKVSALVHQYNKQQFTDWKSSLGRNYTSIISNLRWHFDWSRRPNAYERAIKNWLKGSMPLCNK